MTTEPVAPIRTDDLPLLLAWPGQAFRVVDLDCGECAARRLVALGLIPGSNVEVLRNGRFGALIVKVDSCRLGLGRGLAAKVRVSPVGNGGEKA
jgi:Fe2+ transport system protein FeoA